MPRPIIITIMAAGSLSACDPGGLGYANRYPYPVTIVERGSKLVAPPIRLTAGEIRHPTIGVVPREIDVEDAKGRAIAHYRIRDIPRQDPRGDDYVVVGPDGASWSSRLGVATIRPNQTTQLTALPGTALPYVHD